MFWICLCIFMLPSDCYKTELSKWIQDLSLVDYIATSNELCTLTLYSKLECVTLCAETENCLSVFYIDTTCRLNDAYFTAIKGLVPVSGAVYYYDELNYPCSPVNPCLNGGVCRVTSSSYHCSCVNDYHGDHCESHDD